MASAGCLYSPDQKIDDILFSDILDAFDDPCHIVSPKKTAVIQCSACTQIAHLQLPLLQNKCIASGQCGTASFQEEYANLYVLGFEKSIRKKLDLHDTVNLKTLIMSHTCSSPEMFCQPISTLAYVQSEFERIPLLCKKLIADISNFMSQFPKKPTKSISRHARSYSKITKERSAIIHDLSIFIVYMNRFVSKFALSELSSWRFDACKITKIFETNQDMLYHIHEKLLDWFMIATTSIQSIQSTTGSLASDGLLRPFAWNELVVIMEHCHILLNDFAEAENGFLCIVQSTRQYENAKRTRLSKKEKCIAEVNLGTLVNPFFRTPK